MTGKQMAAEKVEIGVVPQAQEVFGRRYNKFADLVEELRQVNELKKSAEEDSKRLNKELQLMWADCEQKTVLDGGTRITLVQSSSSSINKVDLLELGVSADVILKATRVSNYEFVKITTPKA